MNLDKYRGKSSTPPTFVQVSGGRTSGMMSEMFKDDPDTFFMFQNTGMEKEQTLSHLNEMDKRWGLNLIWLEYHCPDPTKKAGFKVVSYETANRTGVPLEQVIDKRKAIPNRAKRFCTIEAKIKTARRWIRAQGILRWEYAIGYRVDEPTRTVRSDTMQTAITPLKDKGITALDVKDFWCHQDFDLDLPIMPNGKTVDGNCQGCFNHSEFQHARLCKDSPETVKILIRWEKKWGFTFNDNYSYAELLEIVNNSPEFVFNEDGHFCTVTNGSCG